MISALSQAARANPTTRGSTQRRNPLRCRDLRALSRDPPTAPGSGFRGRLPSGVTTDSAANVSHIDGALTADIAHLRSIDRERLLRRVWNRRGAVVETDNGPAVDFSS